jgi:hypothetical protein
MLRIASLLSLALLVLAAPERARACSCMAQEQPQAFDEAVSVFEGRVVSVSQPDAENQISVELDVVRTWKGADAERVTMLTASNSAACGFGFEPTQSYLVYTYEADGHERVSLCSRTAAIESDQARADVAAMGAGVTPVEISDDDDGAGEQLAPPVSPEPSRGGCASCAAHPHSGSSASAWALLSLVALALLSRGRRP